MKIEEHLNQKNQAILRIYTIKIQVLNLIMTSRKICIKNILKSWGTQLKWKIKVTKWNKTRTKHHFKSKIFGIKINYVPLDNPCYQKCSFNNSPKTKIIRKIWFTIRLSTSQTVVPIIMMETAYPILKKPKESMFWIFKN